MATGQQSSLLSLGGGVENLLLSYVSSGDGGLNAILNLRQVCSATKNWVEVLPPLQAKQIFAKTQAKVDLHVLKKVSQGTMETSFKNPVNKIRNFLESPPPLNVNSLKLSGVKEFARVPLSPEEENLWRRFTWFWWERLENLEVDNVDNLLRSNDSRLMHLLSAPSLRHLRCHKLEASPEPLGLPGGFFYVEHLSVDHLRLPVIWTSQFFEYLARTPRLQCFKMSIWRMSHIEEIANFLVLTKHKANLEVTFTFDYSDKLCPAPSRRPLYSTQKQLPPSFVSAVAASAATIRILKLHGKQLKHLKEIVGEETAKKFFETVEFITEFETTGPEHKDLMEFPNLQRLGLLKNSMSHADNNKVLFPPNLQELSVEFGFPTNFPLSLTSLNVYGCRYSVPQLLKSLAVLDKKCPELNCMFLGWNGDTSLEMFCTCCNNGVIQSAPDLQSTTPFRNLRHLSFSLAAASYLTQPDAAVPGNVNGAAWVLLNAFKLPCLSLLKLDLGFSSCVAGRNSLPPVLDHRAMKSLVEGNLAKTLEDVEIREAFVTQDALPLKRTLEKMAKENAEKRRKV